MVSGWSRVALFISLALISSCIESEWSFYYPGKSWYGKQLLSCLWEIICHLTLTMGIYTHAHLWFPPLFLAVNHHSIENWVPSILTHNLWLIIMGMRQEIFFFFCKKIIFLASSSSQKKVIFQLCQFSIFFVKISWIGPWVRRID